MIIAIIAGGSGTRLWPLSQANYPKHLLSLTTKTSLLQNTYRRSKKVTDDVYVITEASHANEVAAQLPEQESDRIIVEPGRRGTASCILLALKRIRQQHDHLETVIFLAADHHIVDEEGFAKTILDVNTAASAQKQITLIGIQPSYPATGFGYIEVGEIVNAKTDARRIVKFHEKPDIKAAHEYLKTGNYLWNLSLFAAPIEVFERDIADFAPTLNSQYQKLLDAPENEEPEVYLDFISQPIDTALIEKTNRTLVIPGKFDWADIGSFFDLHKILKGKNHNALSGDIEQIDCEDSMIHGSGKPIVAIGLKGIVVVDTPEGLLVCAKESAQLVGEASKKLLSKQKD